VGSLKRSSTAVTILVIAFCICVPLFLYDMIQKEAYTNSTSSNTGLTVGYNATHSMITVDYEDIFGDTVAVNTQIYSLGYTEKHPYSADWTSFENTSYDFPVEVGFRPPDKDVTYTVKTTVIRRIGNYTYLTDIIPSSKERSIGV
jgi:cell division protein FtsI/penicillin-binding protein 2